MPVGRFVISSAPMAAVAVCVALGLHVAGLLQADFQEDILLDGGGGDDVSQSSLGTGFADLVQGSQVANDVVDETEATKPDDTIQANQAVDQVEPKEPDSVQETLEAEDVARPKDVTKTQNAERATEEIAAETPSAAVEAQTTTTPTPPTTVTSRTDRTAMTITSPVETVSSSLTLSQTPTLDVQNTPTPSPVLTPNVTVQSNQESRTPTVRQTDQITTAALTPDVATPTETIAADDVDNPEATVSARPQARTKAFEELNKPKVSQPKPANRTTQRNTRQGNAAQSQTAGQTTGSARAPSNQATGQTRSTQAGNARAANYAGIVYRCVSRGRKPRVGVRGTASVRFRVNGSGVVGSVSIARSSGSARLDQAAATFIRSARRCPPPPPGAQRSFAINVEMR